MYGVPSHSELVCGLVSSVPMLLILCSFESQTTSGLKKTFEPAQKSHARPPIPELPPDSTSISYFGSREERVSVRTCLELPGMVPSLRASTLGACQLLTALRDVCRI